MAGVCRGPVASGQPQKLARSQSDIKDDPIGVTWAPPHWARGQHLPEQKGSDMCRKSHTCQPPHRRTTPPQHGDARTTGLDTVAPCSPGILSLAFRPLLRPSGLCGARPQHLLLAPRQCLPETISEGRRVVCLLTPEGPQAHYQLHHQGETVLPAPPTGTVPRAHKGI